MGGSFKANAPKDMKGRGLSETTGMAIQAISDVGVSESSAAVRHSTAKVAGPFQAIGTRAGEVTGTTAIVWARLTAAPVRNNGGAVISKRTKDEMKRCKSESKVAVPVDQLEGAWPGAPRRARLRYGAREDFSDAHVTDVVGAVAEDDFICDFKLIGLKPGTVYHYASEIPCAQKETAFRGKFETAPAADAPGNCRQMWCPPAWPEAMASAG